MLPYTTVYIDDIGLRQRHTPKLRQRRDLLYAWRRAYVQREKCSATVASSALVKPSFVGLQHFCGSFGNPRLLLPDTIIVGRNLPEHTTYGIHLKTIARHKRSRRLILGLAQPDSSSHGRSRACIAARSQAEGIDGARERPRDSTLPQKEGG